MGNAETLRISESACAIPHTPRDTAGAGQRAPERRGVLGAEASCQQQLVEQRNGGSGTHGADSAAQRRRGFPVRFPAPQTGARSLPAGGAETSLHWKQPRLHCVQHLLPRTSCAEYRRHAQCGRGADRRNPSRSARCFKKQGYFRRNPLRRLLSAARSAGAVRQLRRRVLLPDRLLGKHLARNGIRPEAGTARNHGTARIRRICAGTSPRTHGSGRHRTSARQGRRAHPGTELLHPQFPHLRGARPRAGG